jgi:hypothetical protein
VKILYISFGPTISCAYALGYIQTFIRWTLFDLSNKKPSNNLTFVSYSVLIDYCQYLCLPLYRFLFEFFWSQNFWGSCYSSICFICGGFELKPEAKKGWFIANRIVFSFVWRKFSGGALYALYVVLYMLYMLLIELCLVLYEGSFQV